MLKKFLSIVIVSLIVACSYLSVGASFSAFAAEQQPVGNVVIEVEPTSHEIKIAPNQKVQGQVKIRNRGKNDFTVKMDVIPFMVDENYENDYTSESIYTQLHNWIEFDKTEFDLASGEETVVKFTVSAPEDAPGGGQYAAIVAETEGAQEGMFKTSGRVASLVFVTVDGDIREEAEMKSHSIPSFLIGDKISVAATIKNTGNVDFRLSQTMTVRDFFNGRTVFSPSEVSDEGDSKAMVDKTGRFDGVIFPGTSRTGTITWEEGAPSFGLFKVEQTIKYLDQDYTFEGVVFVCPWWLLISVIAFVVLLILWIVLIIIKHRKKKSAAMI